MKYFFFLELVRINRFFIRIFLDSIIFTKRNEIKFLELVKINERNVSLICVWRARNNSHGYIGKF